MRQLEAEDYTIGWICALPLELTAAVAVLDQRHKAVHCDVSDNNIYEFGQVGNCNIIIASLPSGVYGVTSAAVVITNLRRSFPSVTACLMVGIGGGAPLLPRNDIRLGDVVVGHPTPRFGGILPYDVGKTEQAGKFVQTRVLNKPPAIFLQAITKLKASWLPFGPDANNLNDVIDKIMKNGSLSNEFNRPEAESDKLFESHYDHPVENPSCESCDSTMIVERPPRQNGHIQTYIHYGLIASGNQVMKHGSTRDRLSREYDVLCFEMEAAGLADELPTLVIRGICDYSDSHKNKSWQNYASLVAAAFARELLSCLPTILIGGSKQERQRKNRPEEIKQAEEARKSLRSLGATNPSDDKIRIEKAKDELIWESFSWILSDENLNDWFRDTEPKQSIISDTEPRKPIIWISGNPGKGKTMASIGIVKHLHERFKNDESVTISFFFCQATDNRLNTAVSVLKGLIYEILANPNCSQLSSYLREEFERNDPTYFQGINGFYALQRVLSNMFKDDLVDRFYVLVDALDECTGELDGLLSYILGSIEETDKVRWILTSRNNLQIIEELNYNDFTHKISLEMNESRVISAVEVYVDKKLEQLKRRKRYSDNQQSTIKSILQERAGGTFLWVHLACKELAKRKAYEALSILKALPLGLRELYKAMLDFTQSNNSRDELKLCAQILSTVLVAKRPLRLSELAIVSGMPTEMGTQDLEDQIHQCGSFLNVQQDTVFFVHQSAKDFLDDQVGSRLILPKGLQDQHRQIAETCLDFLSENLKADICDLVVPGFLLEDFKTEQKAKILHLDYACCYWAGHIELAMLSDILEQKVLCFIENHLLHWLEATCLLGAAAQTISIIKGLEKFMTNKNLLETLDDVRRFVQYHQRIISRAPLQLYSSVLVFTPENSRVKQLYSHSMVPWIKIAQGIEKEWSDMLQTFYGHKRGITSIAFSPDQKALVSTSYDGSIRSWDIDSGLPGQILSGRHIVDHAELSPDGQQLASVTYTETIKVWNQLSGIWKLSHILGGYKYGKDFVGVNFSGESLPSDVDGEYYVYDDENESEGDIEEEKLTDNSNDSDGLEINSSKMVTFSSDGKLLASGVKGAIQVWDLESGGSLKWHREWRWNTGTHRALSDQCSKMKFSRDNKMLACEGKYNGVQLFDTSSGKLLRSIDFINQESLIPAASDSKSEWKPSLMKVMLLEFLPDANQLLLACSQDMLAICNILLYDTQHPRKVGQEYSLSSSGLKHRSDMRLRYDYPIEDSRAKAKRYSRMPDRIGISLDCQTLVFLKPPREFTLLDPLSGSIIRKVSANFHSKVGCMALSNDTKLLAFGANAYTIDILDLSKNKTSDLEDYTREPEWTDLADPLMVSQDGTTIILKRKDSLTVWDSRNGIKTWELLLSGLYDYAFETALDFSLIAGEKVNKHDKRRELFLWDPKSGADPTIVAQDSDNSPKMLTLLGNGSLVLEFVNGAPSGLKVFDIHRTAPSTSDSSRFGYSLKQVSMPELEELDLGTPEVYESFTSVYPRWNHLSDQEHGPLTWDFALSSDGNKLLHWCPSTSKPFVVHLRDEISGGIRQTPWHQKNMGFHHNQDRRCGFSPDGTLFVFSPDLDSSWDRTSSLSKKTPRTRILWDLLANEEIRCLDEITFVSNAVFLTEDLIKVDSGVIDLKTQDICLRTDPWLEVGGHKLLWLPNEYLPRSFTVANNLIAFENESLFLVLEIPFPLL